MGNPKQKWTSEEEEALRAGVAKYGPGKWKFIQRDSEFNQHLHSRSNIDLKDKWRNISAAAGQGSREKFRTPKPKVHQEFLTAPITSDQTSTSVALVPYETPIDVVMDDTPKELPDAKNAPRYNAMIFEALAATKEPAGLDVGSLVSYIQKRVEVPPKFRKLLSSRLRRLVLQNKLEKEDNCFRIKDKSLSETKSSTIINNNNSSNNNNSTLRKESIIQPRFLQSTITNQWSKNGTSHGQLEAATKFAACKIAETEEMSFRTSEAVKEAERVVRMADESAQVLRFANEIFERCTRGELVRIA